MDKRQIKQLVQLSITGDKLDKNKIEKITALLTRNEFRQYVKGLKKFVREHTVVIEVPRDSNHLSDSIKNQFPGKDVIINKNPKLLLGVRIQDNDDIYEISLADTLKQMEEFLLTTYDR